MLKHREKESQRALAANATAALRQDFETQANGSRRKRLRKLVAPLHQNSSFGKAIIVSGAIQFLHALEPIEIEMMKREATARSIREPA